MASDETCFRGDVLVQYIDKETNEVVEEKSYHNLIMNAGRQAMANLLCSNSTAYDSMSVNRIMLSYLSTGSTVATVSYTHMTSSPYYFYTMSTANQNLTSRIEATATFDGSKDISDSGALVGPAGNIAWYSLALLMTASSVTVFSRLSTTDLSSGWGSDKYMKIIWTVSYG